MSHAEYSRGPRDAPAAAATVAAVDSTPDTIDAAIRAAARMSDDGRGWLNAPRALQSWPGIVHGGAVVALLDAAARAVGVPDGARVIEGRLTSSLPIDTALAVDVEPGDEGTTLIVRRDGQVVSSATVSQAPPAALTPATRSMAASAPRRLRPSTIADPLPSVRPGAMSGPGQASAADEGAAVRSWRGGPQGVALPMSDHCLACGVHNPLGLRTQLSFDDEGVWARVLPGAAWRAPRGHLHAALAPVLLDEVSWWLGALVAGQGGLTNRIRLTLAGDEGACDEPVIAAGRFADVIPVDRRGAFWRARTTLVTEAGAVIATASVVFRGGAEYSAIQMDYFRARTSPAVFRRMFPDAPASERARPTPGSRAPDVGARRPRRPAGPAADE